MPARQLSLFKGKRQRGVAAPPPKEFATHCALADLLRRWTMPGWVWTHFPSGEERSFQIDAQEPPVLDGRRAAETNGPAGWLA